MVYLVDAEETARVSLLGRLRRTLSGDEGYKTGTVLVLGMRMRRVTIKLPPGGVIPRKSDLKDVNRSIERAAGYMRREHAGRLIFTDDFQHKERFLREGFKETDAGVLMTALAGRIAAGIARGSAHAAYGNARAACGNAYAALFARHMAGSPLKTLLELCAAFRYVMAVSGSNDGRVFDSIRRQTGVSVIGQPSQKQLSHTGVAVFYDAPPSHLSLPDGCVAVEARVGALDGANFRRIVTGLSLGLKSGSDPGLPSGFPAVSLFAAALDAGTLKPEDIAILEIFVSDGKVPGS